MTAEATHDQLWAACKKLPGDYDPWGDVTRWEHGDQAYPDCSTGCRFFHTLEGRRGADWGVCWNPASHRCGLLTFEHQGCQQYEGSDDD